MNARSDDDPPGYDRCSKSARRVFDALARSNSPQTRSALQEETHHASRTVRKALAELREQELVERVPSYPSPKYDLVE